MAGSTYWDKLKHPLWQKKRLEVFQITSFACENCGARDSTLHVHHSYYEKGLDPWEYPTESLHALCEVCHPVAQERMRQLHRQIGLVDDTDQLLGYARGLEATNYPMVRVIVDSYEVAMGVADCWSISPEDVIGALQDGSVDGWTLDQLRKRRPV